VACAPKRGLHPEFPRPDALSALAAKTPPPLPGDWTAAEPDEWTLGGPFPARLERVVRAPADAWEKLAADALAGHPGADLTESMTCVARETGRFDLASRAQPSEALRDFLRDRCGEIAEETSTDLEGFDSLGAATDDDVRARVAADVSARIAKLATGDHVGIGIWFGRDGDRGVLAIASGSPSVEVDPVSFTPGPDGKVTLRGRARFPVVGFEGSVTHGALGYAYCDSDENVAAPSFSLTCAVDPADERAQIELFAVPQGRALGRSMLSLLVWPRGVASAEWKRTVLPYAATPGDDLAHDFVARVNALRATAGMHPVDLDARESADGALLAPHYFGAMLGFEPSTWADVIALGLEAGWHVDGPVEWGRMCSEVSPGARDAIGLLGAMVQRPLGRIVLLDPAASRLAFAALPFAGGHAMGTLVTTYALHEAEPEDALMSDVAAQIAHQRAAAGKAAPKLLVDLRNDGRTAAGRVVGGASPDKALRSLMQAAAASLHQPVGGWLLETDSLDHLHLPDELLQSPDVTFGVAVAWVHPAGEAWGHYVVLIVVPKGVPA